MKITNLKSIFIKRKKTDQFPSVDDFILVNGQLQHYGSQQYFQPDYWYVNYFYNGELMFGYHSDHRNNYLIKKTRYILKINTPTQTT